MFPRPRARPDGEGGFTVLELSIAMGILSVVLAIFFAAVVSIQTAVGKATDRSASNDEARLAIQQLDREIRSGNILYNPESETEDLLNGIERGYTMRIYTQTNAVFKCVQWRIMGTELQTRNWAHTNPAGTVSGWKVVARDIVNKTLAVPVKAFVLNLDSNYGRRIMKLALVSQKNGRSGLPVTVEASVTGRNTQYETVGNRCDVIPAY